MGVTDRKCQRPAFVFLTRVSVSTPVEFLMYLLWFKSYLMYFVWLEIPIRAPKLVVFGDFGPVKVLYKYVTL